MRMSTLDGKPSSKDSDTDKKENLGKKEIRPVDRLHQTKFCTSIKNLDNGELEASTSSLQGDSEERDESTFSRLKYRLKYLEDRLNELEQDEKEGVDYTLPRLEYRVERDESTFSRLKYRSERDESTFSRLKSQLKYPKDSLNKLKRHQKKELVEYTLPRLEYRVASGGSTFSCLMSPFERDVSTFLFQLKSQLESDKSTFSRLKSQLASGGSTFSYLMSPLEWGVSTFSRLKSQLKCLKGCLNELENDEKKYLEAECKEAKKVTEEWYKLTSLPFEYRVKYFEDRLNELEQDEKEWEELMLKHYESRKEWEEIMIKLVQSIDSPQWFDIPLPLLSAPMTIPDDSQARVVEQSSDPCSMMTEQESTFDSAGSKQGLIAVQNLPFGMLRNIVYHYLYQKNRVIAGKLLMYMSVLIRSSNDEYIDVWPAYQESAEWNPVFVILCRTNFQGEWDEYAGSQVFKRRYDFVSSEASQVFNSPSVQETRLELNGFLTKCISDTDLINAHSNITIVNACPVRSRNGGRDLTKETCIVIHCRVKGFIPFTEKPFPKMISTFPVDVREGYFVLGMQTPGNAPETNNGTSSNKNIETNDFQPFDTSAQTAQNADLKEHSAASAVNPPFSSSNHLLSNGSQANGDVDKPDDPCRQHERDMDVLSQKFERLSLAYKEPLQGKGQDDFNETLLMGTSISRTGCISSGTLGGFVSLPKGNIGFLTCAHVIGMKNTGTYVLDETNRVFVSQPSDGRICAEYKDRQRECGYVTKAVFEPGAHDSTGVDAVLVTITHRHPKSGEFIRLLPEELAVAGFGQKNPLNFSKGKIMTLKDVIANRRNDLIKVGSKTGVTRGYLYFTDSFFRHKNIDMVTKSGETLTFFKQMEVAVFFQPGDSGALVFMPLKDNELHCMGLAIGYTSYSSCIVTPIQPVFEKLGLNPQSFIDFSCRRH